VWLFGMKSGDEADSGRYRVKRLRRSNVEYCRILFDMKSNV
jgi:hypothetical protein